MKIKNMLTEKERKKRNREKARKYYWNNLEKCKARSKQWREENPEKMKVLRKRWEENNVEKRKGYSQTEKYKEYQKKWAKENPEKVKEKEERYNKNNPEKVIAKAKRYRENHLEECKVRVKRYRENNPERINYLNAKYRARKYNAEGSHTLQEWRNLKVEYNYTCPDCGKKEPEIKLAQDHINPLIRGGSDYISNIQPLCKSCNSIKHDKIIKVAEI